MNKNRLLELQAQYVWPWLRHLVRKSRRCNVCILSEKCSPLVGGVCAACRAAADLPATTRAQASHESLKSLQEQFASVVESHIDARPYHALMLLSGGKDSAYVLHRMKLEFPALRVLCVMVDNGFTSAGTAEAAQHCATALRSDLMRVNSEIPEFARRFRKAFLELDGRGASGVVDHADGTFIFRIGVDVARSFGIPLVIGGLSWVQVEHIVGIDGFELQEPGEPTQVFPLAVWRTDEQEIRALVRKLGLLPPGGDSPITSNNSLILAMSVIDVMNLGYSSFEPEFAQMVREGKTDRTTWLHVFELLEFAVNRGLLKADLENSLKQLDLTVDQVIRNPA